MKKKTFKNFILYIILTLAIFIIAFFIQTLFITQNNYQATEKIKKWTKNYIKAGELSFQRSGLKRYPSPKNWAGEIVYSILVDRFNNGNPENDLANTAGFQKNNNIDYSKIPKYKHGGDLEGIIKRLDYLKDLGVTSLWISPIFKNTGTYHGYNPIDFTKVDPNFGNKKILRKLVKKAHEKEIKIILDIVANHMGDLKTNYSQKPQNREKAIKTLDKNYQTDLNNKILGQGKINFSPDFFPLFKNKDFFSRMGPNTIKEVKSMTPTSIYGDFTPTMFDFNTQNKDFQEIFTNLIKHWIAFTDIDGIRLDAAKHLTSDFVAYFSTHIRDYAQSINKDNFFIIGEIAANADHQVKQLGKIVENVNQPDQAKKLPLTLIEKIKSLKNKYLSHKNFKYPGLNAIYNFKFSGISKDVLLNQKNIKSLQGYFNSKDFNAISNQADYNTFWNVLEIHDWPRFSSKYPENINKTKLGLSYLSVSQGVPVIYYGFEQGLNGQINKKDLNSSQIKNLNEFISNPLHDSLFRQDFFNAGPWKLGSSVAAINKLSFIGKSQNKNPSLTKKDPYLNKNHKVYKTARKVNHIRLSSKALKYGNTYIRYASNKKEGLFAFSRIYKDKEILIIINQSSKEISLPFLTIDCLLNKKINQKYQNLLVKNQTAQVKKDNNWTYLDFNKAKIASNSIMILAPKNNLTKWDDYLDCYKIK